jgi:hypothetical protein
MKAAFKSGKQSSKHMKGYRPLAEINASIESRMRQKMQDKRAAKEAMKIPPTPLPPRAGRSITRRRTARKKGMAKETDQWYEHVRWPGKDASVLDYFVRGHDGRDGPYPLRDEDDDRRLQEQVI